MHGTFLGNNERERVAERIVQRTSSVWNALLNEYGAPHDSMKNPWFNRPELGYVYRVKEEDFLKPRSEVTDMVLFSELYRRWDPRLSAAETLRHIALLSNALLFLSNLRKCVCFL